MCLLIYKTVGETLWFVPLSIFLQIFANLMTADDQCSLIVAQVKIMSVISSIFTSENVRYDTTYDAWQLSVRTVL